MSHSIQRNNAWNGREGGKMGLVKDEMKLDEENAMGKIFVLTALNKNGETALRQIYAQKDSEKEKVIMTKGEFTEHGGYTIWYKFTNASRLMAEHKRMKNKFAPFTVGNVCERILAALKDEKVGLSDVDVEVLNDND